MLKRNNIFMAAAFFMLAIFVTPAFAIYETTIPFKGELEKAARGTVEVEEYLDEAVMYPGAAKLIITAKGLESNAVYTAWLAKDVAAGDLKGLGIENHSFTTDSFGTGRFISTVPEYELRDWSILKIAHHPDGNPENVEGAEVVLTADLERATQVTR